MFTCLLRLKNVEKLVALTARSSAGQLDTSSRRRVYRTISSPRFAPISRRGRTLARPPLSATLRHRG